MTTELDQQNKKIMKHVVVLCVRVRSCLNWFIFYSRQVEFFICSDRCDVGVEYGIANQFQSNPTIDISKLTPYMLAYLIWCSYIEQIEGFHFRPLDFAYFLLLFSYFWTCSIFLLDFQSYKGLQLKGSHLSVALIYYVEVQPIGK